ncbi:hypothetical protein ACFLQU_03875 [Verrucomicrobiota bacterium]
MRILSAIVSFIVVFAGAFFLGGWFLMPYLPPVPDRPITVFEGGYPHNAGTSQREPLGIRRR